ncbi:MAG: hypothetical protein R3F53_29505 [Gammaproteobacteria bacterium]
MLRGEKRAGQCQGGLLEQAASWFQPRHDFGCRKGLSRCLFLDQILQTQAGDMQDRCSA